MKKIDKTEGMVIKCKDFTETSQIIWLYTRDFGKVKVIAKGSRKRSNRFKSKLDLFNKIELVFYQSQKSELHTLSESEIIEPYNEIRTDLAKTAIASYILELLEGLTPLEDPCVEIYLLLTEVLDWLKNSCDIWLIKAVFEIKLLQYTGHFKEPEDVSKGIKAVIRKIAGTERISSLGVLRISEAQGRELAKTIRLIVDYFIDKRLKSVSFLEEVCCGKTG